MKKIFLIFMLFLLWSVPAQAADVTIEWENIPFDIEKNPITLEATNVFQSSISAADGGYYTLIGTVPVTGATGEYTISGLANGTYYFVLTSFYRNIQSEYSEEAWTTIKETVPPMPPAGVTVKIKVVVTSNP